jgi:hypothetical protein
MNSLIKVKDEVSVGDPGFIPDPIFIADPDFFLSRIPVPDPGVKKALDPESLIRIRKSGYGT